MRQVKNQNELKKNNIIRILLEVKKHRNIIKSILANSLNLSFATVSNICTELVKLGYLIEGQTKHATSGRKPTQINFNPSARQILSIDLSDSISVAVALMDLDYKITQSTEFLLDGINTFESLMEKIGDSCSELIAANGVNMPSVIGMGVAVPAVFDTKTHLVVKCSNDLFANMKVKERMEERFRLPVHVANDANMAALGLSICPHAKVEDLLLIYFSRGIGLGIVMGGRVYLGTNGFAGEIGHLKVTDRDVSCRCGQKGCFNIVSLTQVLQQYFGSAVYEMTKAVQEKELHLRKFIRDCEDEIPAALELLEFTGETIGNVVGSLADLFNPSLIAIGGNISPIFHLLLPIVQSSAKKRSFITSHVDLKIIGIENVRTKILQGNAENVFQSWLLSEDPFCR